MTGNRHNKNRRPESHPGTGTVLFILVCLPLLCTSMMTIPLATALAEERPVVETPPALPKNALQNLARKFVEKIGAGLQTADELMSSDGKVALAEKLSGTEIPDGETLIMQAVILTDNNKKKLPLSHDIQAYKDAGTLYVSLTEFFSAADFAIAVDASAGTASGWFIREDQPFYLDVTKNEVRIIEQSQVIDSSQILIQDNDILVSSVLLEKWFGIEINFDFSDLSLQITTTQPFPAEDRYARRNKLRRGQYDVGAAKLPLQEEPYRLFSPPSVDVGLGMNYLKSNSRAQGQLHQSWTALGSGDLAGFSNTWFLGGSDQYYLSEARITFEKENPDGGLLGPLDAKTVQFGDVYGINIPLLGPSNQEQGIRISNKVTNRTSLQDSIDIQGDIPPGWDVELYRKRALLGFQSATDSGQYNFPDIPLFAGENELKLVFYGPQGEIREEDRSVTIDPKGLDKTRGIYDVAITRSNTLTYRATDPSSKDTGEPHIAARYEYNLGTLGVADIALRDRSIDGQHKTMAEAGLSQYILGGFLNTNIAYDNDGEYGAQILARRNFGGHALRLRYKMNSDRFMALNSLNDVPTQTVEASASGRLPDSLFKQIRFPGYEFNGQYMSFDDGQLQINSGLGINMQLANIQLGSEVEYNLDQNDAIGSHEDIGLNINARGFLLGGRWKTIMSYALEPDIGVEKISGQYVYPFTRKIKGTADLEHNVASHLTETKLGLNWKTGQMTIAPRISANTNNRMSAALNINFGLSQEPHTGKYAMFDERISNSGGVSARIFLDRNGDGIPQEGEDWLEDVELEAPQVRHYAKSDKNGIAFIPDLPKGQVTDIRIDEGTLPDSYYISTWKGASLRPRPGIVTQLDFPIVVTGEIDGMLSLRDEAGNLRPARQFTLNLMSPDGVRVQTATAAYDGFYLFTQIPPGLYYITLDAAMAEKTGYGLDVPLKLEIAPDGTTLFGTNIILKRQPHVAYDFSSNRETLPPPKYHAVQKFENVEAEETYINLGEYNSRLALSLAWYRFKLGQKRLAKLLALKAPVSEIEPDPKTGLLKLKARVTGRMEMEDMSRLCSYLTGQKFNCSVEIFTHYKPPVYGSGS